MGTLTLATARNLIRSELNESTTTALSDTELNNILNDGYKDVAVKALCYESKVAKDNIAAEKILSLVSTNPVRVNFVEYKSGTTEGGKGLLCILPQASGRIPINGNAPQFWFAWWRYLIVEPLPDAATYDLAVYASCYPAAVRSSDSDLFDSLPAEFHECVYLFGVAFACLKLKRWQDAAIAYNQYIASVQMKRSEYVMKYADARAAQKPVDEVQMVEGNRG